MVPGRYSPALAKALAPVQQSMVIKSTPPPMVRGRQSPAPSTPSPGRQSPALPTIIKPKPVMLSSTPILVHGRESPALAKALAPSPIAKFVVKSTPPPSVSPSTSIRGAALKRRLSQVPSPTPSTEGIVGPMGRGRGLTELQGNIAALSVKAQSQGASAAASPLEKSKVIFFLLSSDYL